MKQRNVLTVSVLTCFATLLSSCAGTASTLSAAPGGQSVEKVWNFDSDETGRIARGFESDLGQWKVVGDAGSPSKPHVLAQLAKSSRSTFNVALAAETSYGDVDISLKFKSLAGEVDQGGGAVWRAKDAKNYYIARYNPLEDNYRVYKVVNGRRRQLESADIDRAPGWHTLRVTMRGDHIKCYYDGEKHLDVKDQTFTGPGRIGLWTKADAQTHFDDLRVSTFRAPGLDREAIARAAGAKATVTPDGIVRIGWPRKDVPLKVDGMPFNPSAGLGSWAAFQAMEHGAMVMGDTVVFQDEVAAAMDAAFASGLEVSALHNHFFFDEPKVYFMHIGGNGHPETLARGVKSVWDAIKEVRSKNSTPARTFPGGVPTPGPLDKEGIEKILGHKGASKDGGVLKFSIGRVGEMHETGIGPSMGLSSWAAFSGSDRLASVDGDFIMTAEEVQPVLRALRKADIYVVALHNHMIGEKPTFYFTHFWGKGPARTLAEGIRSTLAAQKEAQEK